jgi:glycosyltransferase involved in cell wall biosynthesis
MINIIAPVNQLGYGLTGLNITKELYKYDNKLSLFVIGQPQITRQEDVEPVQQCMKNAMLPNWTNPCLRIWHQNDMSQFVGEGERIGFPIFELEKFDEIERHHLCNLDRIFVCSSWAKSVIHDNIDISDDRVAVIPLGVDNNIFKPEKNPSEKTIFFNCGKWEVRKGHDIIWEIFNKAFTKDDNVELWMMCQNPFLNEQQEKEWRNLYEKSPLGSKIRMINRVATQDEVYNIMKRVDCGIFPAKAEGWNLEILELMSCGKHVITTNVTGHTEFCDNNNTKLVDLTEKEIAYDGVWFLGNKGSWPKINDSNKEEFIQHMRDIHELKKSNQLPINSHGISTAQKFTWANAAKKVMEQINGQ